MVENVEKDNEKPLNKFETLESALKAQVEMKDRDLESRTNGTVEQSPGCSTDNGAIWTSIKDKMKKRMDSQAYFNSLALVLC